MADFAEADTNSGKVHILGAGWSVTNVAPSPQAVVVFLKIPTERAASPVQLTLRLLDSERKIVEVPGLSGPQPVEIVGQIEIGQPSDGWDPLREVNANFAVNVAPLALNPASIYTWSCEIDGKEVAEVAFLVRSATEAA